MVVLVAGDTVENWIGPVAQDVEETAEHWLVGAGGLGAAA